MHKRLKQLSHLMPRMGLLAILTLSVLAMSQHQAIHDWLSLRGYDPPLSVVQLADQTGMTAKTRRLFYVNHPAVEDRDLFNTACSNHGEHTIVLGCYHPVEAGIYVFHVSDDRLDGIDQVTVAHETLHAAYDRLSSTERTRVSAMLQSYYKSGLYDDRIKAIIATYKKTEPNDVVNEMHSVFGTEVLILPTDLEMYYRQYFSNRSKIVAYANTYQAEFTSRQSKVADYDQQLKFLKQDITDNTSSLDRQETQIANLRSRLDSYRASGDIEQYNNNVPAYNSQIDNYNALISRTKQLIISYNSVVATRNQLALQVSELAHSIDSTFQPISQ